MGLIHADITMKNATRPKGRAVRVRALVDGGGEGATLLRIPETLRAKLKLEVIDTRVVTLASGEAREMPYAGPVEVRFKNRVSIGGALVTGGETMLGTIPMSDMDVVILPKPRRLDVNPESAGVRA